jgi:hypothetical protein
MYCQHEDCRAHAVEELFYMARRLMRPDLAELAVKALHGEVRCRRVPRRGPVPIPFFQP